jgi:hypothetical protein
VANVRNWHEMLIAGHVPPSAIVDVLPFDDSVGGLNTLQALEDFTNDVCALGTFADELFT